MPLVHLFAVAVLSKRTECELAVLVCMRFYPPSATLASGNVEKVLISAIVILRDFFLLYRNH